MASVHPRSSRVFDPENETAGARRKYHGRQPVPPTLVSQPSLNIMFSHFNSERSKTEKLHVNLPSVATNNDNVSLSSQIVRLLNVHEQSQRPYSQEEAASADLAQVPEIIAEAPHLPSPSWPSSTTSSKQIKSQPADQYQNALTFITDTSAMSPKPSAIIGGGETRKGMGRTPSAGPKFAACWKCKALRKRVGERNPVRFLIFKF
jgi:hypothetical protein